MPRVPETLESHQTALHRRRLALQWQRVQLVLQLVLVLHHPLLLGTMRRRPSRTQCRFVIGRSKPWRLATDSRTPSALHSLRALAVHRSIGSARREHLPPELPSLQPLLHQLCPTAWPPKRGVLTRSSAPARRLAHKFHRLLDPPSSKWTSSIDGGNGAWHAR